MSHTLLFLCTGNYYRSRFAEALFNNRARHLRLPWAAESRGVALDLGVDNVGPMSAHALRGLRARGIALNSTLRFPIQATESDLTEADLIVALDEAEHRPLVAVRYPAWVDRIEYWDVPDTDRAEPDDAMRWIEQQVAQLLARLAHDHTRPA